MSADLTGQHLGHYEIRSVLGLGGMSTVYRAVDVRLDRPVALKVISEDLSRDQEFRDRFAEEAKAASAIDHVNIVPLYDFGETDGWLYIAMRLVDGTDLAQEIAQGPLPRRRVLDLLGQVGAALDLLHERGLVHLDVKPANILITRSESVGREHVYLADFGLTRRGAAGHRTAAGDFLGSPTYASPEHLRGEPVLPASDLYSLTCVVFTCLAGRAPFTGTVKEVVAGHLAGQVPSLAALTDLPPAVDRVIARGLAGDPALRYPTAGELLGSLRRALSDRDDEPAGLTAAPAARPSAAVHGLATAPSDTRPTDTRPTDARPAGTRPGAASPPAGPSRAAAAGPAAAAPRTTPSGPPVASRPPGGRPVPSPAGPGPLPAPAGPPLGGPSRPPAGPAPVKHRAQPAGRSPWPWVVVGLLVLIAAAVAAVVIWGR